MTETIVPRRLDLNFPSQIPENWYDDNAYLSLFFDTLSALFPEGEKFFVDSVRNYRDQITDPTLKADIAAFIAQEAMHTREHVSFNAAMQQRSVNLEKIDKQLRPILKSLRKVLPKSTQLAVTCALEHFTANLAEQLLNDPKHQGKIHPEMTKLWLWHALEEIEHKNVAYDVYEEVAGNYAERVGTMAAVTVGFFALTLMWHTKLMYEQKQLTNKDNIRGIKQLFGKDGLFTKLLPEYLEYYSPTFHPSDRYTDDLVREWRTNLFSEGGQLYGIPKQPNGKPLVN